MSSSTSKAVSALSGDARRNLLVTLIGRGGSIALNFLVTVWVIRYLGPERYGIYVWVLSLITLVDLATEISLFEIAIREMAKVPKMSASWLGAATLVRAAIGVGLGVVMAILPYFVTMSDSTAATVQTGALVFLFNSIKTPVTYFRARLMIHWELGLWILTRGLEFGLVVWISYADGGAALLMGAKAASTALFVTAMWYLLLIRERVRFSWPTSFTKPLIAMSIPLGLTTLLMLIQLKGDILLMGYFLDAAAVGAYGAVAQIPEFVLVAISIINATLGPLLARHLGQNDTLGFQNIIQKFISGLILITPSIAILVSVFAESLLRLAFGAEYLEVASQFRILCWVSAVLPIAGVMGVAAVTLNLQRYLVKVELVNVLIYFTANLLLLPICGSIASAWIRLLVVIIGPTWTYCIIRQHSPYKISWRIAIQSTILATLTLLLSLAIEKGTRAF